MAKEGTNRHRYTIIDEADEMVGADWAEDLKMIFSGGGMHRIGRSQ